MILSEQFVKTVRGGKTPQLKADGGTGLALMVQAAKANGKDPTKTYYWRNPKTGRKLKIARVDTMKVTEARHIALQYTNMARQGIDPAMANKRKKERAAKTFDQVWNRYHASVVLHQKSGHEKTRMYEKDIKPALGDIALERVTTDDLRDAVRKATDRSNGAGRMVYAILGAFYTWCAEEGEVSESPMFKKRWPKPNCRTRFLKEHEIEWFLQACYELREGYTVAAGNGAKRKNKAVGRWAHAYEILLRTGQRMTEITDLVESEVDERESVMTLPPARFKGGREHALPLPKQVMLLLDSVDRPDTNDRYFQRLGQADRSLKAIRERMEMIAGEEIPSWSAHDLRRTFDTTMREAWDEEADRPVADGDVIEAILGHSLKGVARHYNHSTMLRNKRRVLNWWNDYLDGLVDTKTLKLAA